VSQYSRPCCRFQAILYISFVVGLKIVKDSFERIEFLSKKSAVKVINRILIIDDDDHIRKMLRKMLEREGYIVSEFEVAKSLGAITLKKPFEQKNIIEAIKQMQNLI
jgi:PleD family two-component response regulator